MHGTLPMEEGNDFRGVYFVVLNCIFVLGYFHQLLYILSRILIPWNTLNVVCQCHTSSKDVLDYGDIGRGGWE